MIVCIAPASSEELKKKLYVITPNKTAIVGRTYWVNLFTCGESLYFINNPKSAIIMINDGAKEANKPTIAPITPPCSNPIYAANFVDIGPGNPFPSATISLNSLTVNQPYR